MARTRVPGEQLIDGPSIQGISDVRVPGAGLLFLAHGGLVSHSVVPVNLMFNVEVISASILVSLLDTNRSFELQIYSDPAGIPVLVTSVVTLPINTLQSSIDLSGSPVALNAGDYGLAIARVTGSGPSTFRDIVGTLFVRKT